MRNTSQEDNTGDHAEEAARDAAHRARMEADCERDGGHVYEVTPQGVQRCAFCDKQPAAGDSGHVIDRRSDK